MAISFPSSSLISVDSPLCHCHFRNLKSPSLLISCSRKTLVRFNSTVVFSTSRNATSHSSAAIAIANVKCQAYSGKPAILPESFVRLAVSVVMVLGFGLCFGLRECSASSSTITATSSLLEEMQTKQGIKWFSMLIY